MGAEPGWGHGRTPPPGVGQRGEPGRLTRTRRASAPFTSRPGEHLRGFSEGAEGRKRRCGTKAGLSPCMEESQSWPASGEGVVLNPIPSRVYLLPPLIRIWGVRHQSSDIQRQEGSELQTGRQAGRRVGSFNCLPAPWQCTPLISSPRQADLVPSVPSHRFLPSLELAAGPLSYLCPALPACLPLLGPQCPILAL